jgi:hypothetical protein
MYNSTREAIQKFLALWIYDTVLITDLLTIEKVATLAEWDETFQIRKGQIDDLLQLHLSISKKNYLQWHKLIRRHITK